MSSKGTAKLVRDIRLLVSRHILYIYSETFSSISRDTLRSICEKHDNASYPRYAFVFLLFTSTYSPVMIINPTQIP